MWFWCVSSSVVGGGGGESCRMSMCDGPEWLWSIILVIGSDFLFLSGARIFSSYLVCWENVNGNVVSGLKIM